MALAISGFAFHDRETGIAREDRGQLCESGACFDKCQRCPADQVAQAVDEGRNGIIQAEIGAGGPQLQDLGLQAAQLGRFLTALERQREKLVRLSEERGQVQPEGPDGFSVLHDRKALAVGTVPATDQPGGLQRFEMTAQLAIGETLGPEAEGSLLA